MAIASMKSVFGSPKPEVEKVATKKAETKKAAVKKAVAPPANTRADIKITCMVETLDGGVHEQVIRIDNPIGCIIGTQRNNPDYVFDILRAGLAAKLGMNHIK